MVKVQIGMYDYAQGYEFAASSICDKSELDIISQLDRE
jgi:hypothetical protein